MTSRSRGRFRCGSLICTIGFLTLHPPTASAQTQPDSVSAPVNPLDAVVISATRSEQTVSSLPSTVNVIGAPAIAATSSGTVQDILRSIPGFATRDYQSGYIAGPSQSMVTFRGLGGSSAGRVLVLLDGLPIGDPFSGWLDWGRIPLPMLASAEVIRGGGSIIWGSRALGGVVNLRTVSPRRDEASISVERGSFDTWHTTGIGSLKRGKFSAVIGADYLDTDGFILTPPDQAGPVDKPQAMRNRVVSAKMTFDATETLQTWIGGSTFQGGERPWGIADDQKFDEGRTGIRFLSAAHGIATLSAFANRRSTRSKSYSVNSDRTAETPQRFGKSPARSAGLNMQWTQLVRGRHELTSGADITSASGSLTEEYLFTGDDPREQREAGGSQQFAGVFIQDAADIGHALRMVASARLDRVHSSDGRRTIRSLPALNILLDSSITDHTDVRLTYSFGLRRQQASWLGLRMNVYEAFRAPSMYEMYHPRFSSRGTVTEANSQLDAERLRGAEAGFDVTLGRNAVARLTGFTNHVASPIMDITIATAGSQAQVISPCGLMPARQTCSQRQNVPGLESNGVETELSWQPFTAWTLGAGYSYSSTHTRAPGQPVDGKHALRSSPHSVVSSVAFDNPRWFSAAVEMRYVGKRFEDDLNTIELDDFYLVGLRANRTVGPRLTAMLKVENLLDEQFEISRTRAGLAEQGARRWVTLGLKTTW